MDPQTAALEREHEAVSADCHAEPFMMVSVCILILVFCQNNLCHCGIMLSDAVLYVSLVKMNVFLT